MPISPVISQEWEEKRDGIYHGYIMGISGVYHGYMVDRTYHWYMDVEKVYMVYEHIIGFVGKIYTGNHRFSHEKYGAFRLKLSLKPIH